MSNQNFPPIDARCYARWIAKRNGHLAFRDQTILQYGNSWDLLVSFVLLNPGSAEPLNSSSKAAFLRGKSIPGFIESNGSQDYYEFSVDQLMRNLISLFSSVYQGGVIRLFNLFNFKNQDSTTAMAELKEYKDESEMFSSPNQICYASAPVVIAPGKNAFKYPALTDELRACLKKREMGIGGPL